MRRIKALVAAAIAAASIVAAATYSAGEGVEPDQAPTNGTEYRP